MWILCPYDTSRLEAQVLAHAEQTHPMLMRGRDRWRSDVYTRPEDFWAATASTLAPVPELVESFAISEDLAGFRGVVRRHASAAGLSVPRVEDLLIAANEAATNTLIHAGGSGRARLWREEGHLVCEIADEGTIADPLVGRRRPEPGWSGGRGLWLVNQLCDLVELRAAASSTTLRLHMRLN